MPYKEKSLNPAWIRSGTGLTWEPIKWAQEFGQFLAKHDREARQKELSTSQIRRFFGLIKRLQAKGYDTNSRTDLLMLLPQLAYAVGRDKKRVKGGFKDGSKIHYFYNEMGRAIDAIASDDIKNEQIYFKNFVNLVEAIVAYHRFAGGE